MDYSFFYETIKDKLSVNENEIYRKTDAIELEYLKSNKYPICIVEFYNYGEPKDCIELNGARLWPIQALREENENYIPGYIIYNLGYRVIGTTIYGDVYCININQLENGQPHIFIASHDEIYEGLANDEITSKIIMISSSFNEFLGKFAKELLPIDYYDVTD